MCAMHSLTDDQQKTLLELVAVETDAKKSLEFLIGRTDDDVYIMPLNGVKQKLHIILPDWLEVFQTNKFIEIGRGLSDLPPNKMFVLTGYAYEYADYWKLPAWRRWIMRQWKEAKPELITTVLGIASVIITEVVIRLLF